MTLQDKLKALAEGKKLKFLIMELVLDVEIETYAIAWLEHDTVKMYTTSKGIHETTITRLIDLIKDKACGIVEFEGPLPSSGTLSLRYSVYSDKYEIVSKNGEDPTVYTIAFFDIGKESIDVRLVYGRFLEENRDDFIKVLYESQIYLQKKFLSIRG